MRAQQVRLLALELTQAEQRERSRLAQVLHDGLQQLLVASRMRLSRLDGISDAEVRRRAQEVDGFLSESIKMSRSLTADLSPPALREGGLISGLDWLASWMHAKQGLAVTLEVRPPLAPVSEELIVLLFQATRELLFNVVKHAQVKTARVGVVQRGEGIRIAVADDGVGFEVDRMQRAAGGGFGLFSMRERLGLFDGQVRVTSAPGRGCEVLLDVPLIAAPTAPWVRALTPLADTGRSRVQSG